MDKNGDEPLIDPKVKEELEENIPEDPVFTEYAKTGKNSAENEKVEATTGFIGDSQNWQTKTKLSAEQIIALTQVRMLPHVFEEIGELEGVFNETVNNLEQYAVSHGGLSREQAVSVLRALNAGEMHDDTDSRSKLIEAFAKGMDNNDE